MNYKRYAAIGILTLAMVCSWGCKTDAQTKPAATPSPSPSPVPKMGAVIDSPTFALSDKNGQPVAKISADSAAATGTGDADALGEMKHATATLYQNGKQVATMTADKLNADAKTRVLIAQGNVRVESSDKPGDKKTVRADTVRWEYDNNKIVGSNNVVLQQGDLIRIPAASFTADTALKKCSLHNNGSSITGSY